MLQWPWRDRRMGERILTVNWKRWQSRTSIDERGRASVKFTVEVLAYIFFIAEAVLLRVQPWWVCALRMLTTRPSRRTLTSMTVEPSVCLSRLLSSMVALWRTVCAAFAWQARQQSNHIPVCFSAYLRVKMWRCGANIKQNVDMICSWIFSSPSLAKPLA